MSDSLRKWLQEKGWRVRDLADHLGKPLSTVEDWVYEGKMPLKKNRALVYSLTDLAEFQPSEPATGAKTKAARSDLKARSKEHGERKSVDLLIKGLKGHIEAAQELLRFFAEASPDLRDMLRARLDPKGVAYFSGLVRAILSEERLREFGIAAEVSNSFQRGQR